MTRLSLPAALLACAVGLFGCLSACQTNVALTGKQPVGELQAERPAHEPPFVVRYRALAAGYERSDEARKALFMWQVVSALSPDDRDARRRAKELEKQLNGEAEKHFEKGVQDLKNGSSAAGREELLLALTYNPEHREALDYFRKRAIESDYFLYEAEEGDSPAKVAKKVYGDPTRGFLVAYFSDVSPDGQLRAGTRLMLPIIEAEVKAAQAKPVSRTKPGNAQRSYDRVAAEEHYAKGVGYFLAQELQQALNEWEETLRLYPEHPNAQRDIQKVRNLLKRKN